MRAWTRSSTKPGTHQGKREALHVGDVLDGDAELTEIVGRRGLELVGEDHDGAVTPGRGAGELLEQRVHRVVEHAGAATTEPRGDTDAGRCGLHRHFWIDAPQAATSRAAEMGVERRLLLGDALDQRLGTRPSQHQRLTLEGDVPLDLGQQHRLARAPRADDDGVELVAAGTTAEPREDGVKDLLTTGQQRRRDTETGVERVLRILLDISAFRGHHVTRTCPVKVLNSELNNVPTMPTAPMDTAGYLTSKLIDTVYERGVTRSLGGRSPGS